MTVNSVDVFVSGAGLMFWHPNLMLARRLATNTVDCDWLAAIGENPIRKERPSDFNYWSTSFD